MRPGKDVGTSIVTGATPERFEIVKWFYIEADDDTGYDAAADVIARALTHLDRRTPIAELDVGPQPVVRDLLADLVAVLGDQRVPVADVPARLRDLAPDHPPYRGMTGVKLREILEREYGIKVASTGNRYPVDPHKIRACIARRAADGPDGCGGLTVEATGEVPLRACMRTRNGIPTDLTRLTLRRSAAVRGSGGDRVKDLTPDVGPHSHGIANWGRSTYRTDARPIASPTGEVGIRCPNLEPVSADPTT